jgi:photosystem II stability/assembly factor-like uncharacterized protein
VTDALQGVSFLGNNGLAVGIAGRELRTTDGGLNWNEQPRPTTRNLYAVSLGSRMTVATGEEGTILVSPDFGLTWASHTAGTASILFGVSVNDSSAVGVGGQGAIVMSVDGGAGWGLTVLGNQLTFFYATSFVNQTTGWAVGSDASGNLIIKSTLSGFVWTGETAPTTEQLFGVSFTTPDSGGAVGTSGTIIHTSDGGTTWLNQPSGTLQTLNAISFANPELGVAVGNGGTILRTTNGGITSIGEHPQQNAISLYPNPADDFVTLAFDNPGNRDLEIVIYNVLGEKVGSEMLNGSSQVINTSGLNNGIYLVAVKSPGLTRNQRLIIQR